MHHFHARTALNAYITEKYLSWRFALNACIHIFMIYMHGRPEPSDYASIIILKQLETNFVEILLELLDNYKLDVCLLCYQILSRIACSGGSRGFPGFHGTPLLQQKIYRSLNPTARFCRLC